MDGRLQSLTITAVVAAGGWAAPGALADELRITADTPAVMISTRQPTRNFITLPDLDYVFELRFACSAALQPRAVSLSIADTRMSLPQSQLAGPPGQRVSLTIPAGQIPPVRIETFCRAEPGDGETPERRVIPGVLSVQGSLVCADDEKHRITYASIPLDVAVHCERPEAPISAD